MIDKHSICHSLSSMVSQPILIYLPSRPRPCAHPKQELYNCPDPRWDLSFVFRINREVNEEGQRGTITGLAWEFNIPTDVDTFQRRAPMRDSTRVLFSGGRGGTLDGRAIISVCWNRFIYATIRYGMMFDTTTVLRWVAGMQFRDIWRGGMRQVLR